MENDKVYTINSEIIRNYNKIKSDLSWLKSSIQDIELNMKEFDKKYNGKSLLEMTEIVDRPNFGICNHVAKEGKSIEESMEIIYSIYKIISVIK